MSITSEKNEVEIAVESVILISQKAVEQVLRIQNDEFLKSGETKLVRVSVVGGGCSGLSYKIAFDVAKPKDHHVNLSAASTGEAVLIIDPKSSIYLKGTLLDFEDGLDGKGFVFKNPNAKNTCGCGESFSF
jgi:iron-sulfur cluster assembly protein